MSKYTYSNGSAFQQEVMTMDKFIEAFDKAVKAASEANEWMLIGPDGHMWKTSETRELIRVLSPYAMKEMFP